MHTCSMQDCNLMGMAMDISKLYKRFHDWAAGLPPDSLFIRRAYKRATGRTLDLRHPVTFNDKIQWIKIHDRKSEYTVMADKLAAKKFVSDKVGSEYVIPLLGSWARIEEVELNNLPQKFVLKTNHDSGGLVICHDKFSFNWENAKEKLANSLAHNYYWNHREWVYKNIRPCVLAEPLLEPKDGDEVIDYKFLVFNGVAKAMFVATNRHRPGGAKFNYYDMEWNPIPVVQPHHLPNPIPPKKPQHFGKMIELAETLSVGTYLLRVDFYEIDGKVYVGEMTFYPDAGIEPFIPSSYEFLFGSWIHLPCDK